MVVGWCHWQYNGQEAAAVARTRAVHDDGADYGGNGNIMVVLFVLCALFVLSPWGYFFVCLCVCIYGWVCT